MEESQFDPLSSYTDFLDQEFRNAWNRHIDLTIGYERYENDDNKHDKK